MKIRNGFVSNSSSSSFIIVGVKNNKPLDESDLPKGIESLYVEGSEYDYVTGIVLADVSDDGDYLEEKSISFSEINEMAEKVSTALNVDIDEVKLIMGTRPS
jgi:hypothetical protein